MTPWSIVGYDVFKERIAGSPCLKVLLSPVPLSSKSLGPKSLVAKTLVPIEYQQKIGEKDSAKH
jgi:hypothetical protein